MAETSRGALRYGFTVQIPSGATLPTTSRTAPPLCAARLHDHVGDEPRKPEQDSPVEQPAGAGRLRAAATSKHHGALAPGQITTPGYDGWPLVLLRLAEVDVGRLGEIVTEPWRTRSPASPARPTALPGAERGRARPGHQKTGWRLRSLGPAGNLMRP